MNGERCVHKFTTRRVILLHTKCYKGFDQETLVLVCVQVRGSEIVEVEKYLFLYTHFVDRS